MCVHVGERGRESEEDGSLRVSGVRYDLFSLFFYVPLVYNFKEDNMLQCDVLYLCFY